MNTNETNDNDGKIIFDVFSQDDIKALKDEYTLMGVADITLRKIATPIFRKYNIRSFGDATQGVQDIVKTAFFNIQRLVLTVPVTHYTTVEHKKGDFIRDAKGDPIPTDDGRGYKTYTKDVTERVEKIDERPFFDHTKDRGALKDITTRLLGIEVLPDYDKLRSMYLSNVDYKHGCDLIRNLTKYYIFDEPEKFVERFALLVCNAKAKALGFQPKWPVLFSLVGKMGVGKSWLAQMVKETHDKAFSCKSGVTSYGRLLDGQFNAMMMTRGFLSLDEAQGLDRGQCEKLKTYITSQQVDIERKGLDVQTCDNLVTFFSTTNESVRDVMGYQPDRRIVEFVIKEKKGEIPEDTIVQWLDEIWRVMPVEHPTQQLIKDELLSDSTNALDLNMGGVVGELFNDHSGEFVNAANNRIVMHKFKRAVKEIGGVPFSRVRDWCLDKGLLKKDGEGRITAARKAIKDFLDTCDSATTQPSDLNDLFDVEG